MKNAHKKNAFARYFTPFGLRQICDILMLVGAITLIVGLCINNNNLKVCEIILLIGLAIYILASVIAIVRAVLVLTSKINHRAPEYKRAIANTVIMSVILALAVFGLIYLLVA